MAKMYCVEIKGTTRTFKRPIDAINYYHELLGKTTAVNWQMIRALDCIINGDIKLYYGEPPVVEEKSPIDPFERIYPNTATGALDFLLAASIFCRANIIDIDQDPFINGVWCARIREGVSEGVNGAIVYLAGYDYCGPNTFETGILDDDGDGPYVR